MTGLTATIGCVGITIPAQSSYQTRVLAGYTMVDVPGGLFVMGSSLFPDAAPRWVGLDRYWIAQTTTSEGQYREAMGRPGQSWSPSNHPAGMITYRNILEYLSKRGEGLTLPTEAQWENAARGSALNMHEVMEEEAGRFKARDFADFAHGRFENFVFEPLGQIFDSPRENEKFRKMIEQGMPFFGWRVYGTPSGRLTPDESWYRQRESAPVDWGPEGPYGLKGMTGGTWELVSDWYARWANKYDVWNPTGPLLAQDLVKRGASFCDDSAGVMSTAYRGHDHSDLIHASNLGFRVGARCAVPS